MDINKIREIQSMIKRHQDAVQKSDSRPAGHNTYDEDLSKVASNDVIAKTDPTDVLRK